MAPGKFSLLFCKLRLLSGSKYATTRIDNQILALQNCIAAQSPRSPPPGMNSPPSPRMMQINRIKGDLIMTIRQVVEIISNYAGSALPEPARTTVRGFILTLPQRWASANAGAPGNTEGEEASSSRSPTREERAGSRRLRGSRHDSRSHRDRPGSPSSVEESSQNSVNASAQRILTLATESLDMLHNVTTVFNQSLERAEA